jgi:hypothetical protein
MQQPVVGAAASHWGKSMRQVTTALYIDFDNIYGGLAEFDRSTAEAFANDPARLLDFLSAGIDEDGPFRRRFLVRDCYINPQNFAKYRPQFVAAGFRVIDCPSLTQRGKSAADTHIVIDVVDAISHQTRYDEFVICSADADFSPLMTKLRRHDRRTVMVAAGNAAPAYLAVCDVTIGAMEIAAAFSGDEDGPQLDTPSSPETDQAHSEHEVDAAVAAIRSRVASSTAPVPGSAAAAEAGRAAPGIARGGWAGAGDFASFIAERLPELRFVRTDSGGRVVDPARHPPEITEVLPEADDLPSRISRVTKVPPLTSEQYAVLFDELAHVAKTQTRLARIGYDVRERAADSAAPVPRKSVDFVVTGLVYGKSDPREPDLHAQGLAKKWLEIVLQRCDQAGLELDGTEKVAVREWILGGLTTAS